MYSNIITPPDFVTEQKHTVVLIDAEKNEIEQLASLCRQIDAEFNIYLYIASMDDQKWLSTAINLADTVIVNSSSTSVSDLKDQLCNQNKCWYYGEKTFANNTKKLANPTDYFVQYATKEVNTKL